jgi:UDP-N-acetylmuramoyl-L-alanyl-D-glutamate--2,6-diaminopimelate ligase
VASKNAKLWVFSATNKENSLVSKKPTEKVTTEKIIYSLNGIKFYVCWRNEKARVQTKIVGDFNLENILAVMTVLLAKGYALNVVADKVSRLLPVKGRMEGFGGNKKPFVFVDYAHTPDALEKLLLSLKKYSQQKLCLIFGCGGNRDKGKRAEMGAIAGRYADRVVITNDNPRYEDPQQIINSILEGCLNQDTEVIQNRTQAIQTVIKKANESDCIVIAGKGHEDYQEIKGIKHPFSDQEIVKQALQEWVNP